MRLIAWLVGLPLTLIVVLFAVSNRQPIVIGFWPFTDGITAPAFLIGLVPLAIGLLVGAGFASVGTVRAHLRHRGAVRRGNSFERQLAELRDRTPAIAPPSDKSAKTQADPFIPTP